MFSMEHHHFENMFQTPIVKGMKVLDRTKFEFKYAIPSLSLLAEELNSNLQMLKFIQLKLPNLTNPIKVDNKRTYLLDTKYKQILEKNNMLEKFSEAFSHKIISYDLPIVYENWKYSDIFKAILPDDCNNLSSYSSIGHIIHLNLKEVHLYYKYIIGQVFLDKIKACKTVLNKLKIISNEYRNFEYEYLAGDHNTNVEVHENRCRFLFDFSKVYWNPRLSTERERVLKLIYPQDIVFDIFAGVGPFTIPAAKVVRCKAVYANDLNPDCFTYLQNNILKNKIKKDIIYTYCLDAKEFILTVFKPNLLNLILSNAIVEGAVDETENNFNGDIHIIMNLPEKAIDYLAIFKNLLSKDLTDSLPKPPSFNVIVHLYCFVRDRDLPEIAGRQKLLEVMKLNSSSRNLENKDTINKKLKLSENDESFGDEHILEVYHVRKVSPSKDMIRLTFKLPFSYLGLNIE